MQFQVKFSQFKGIGSPKPETALSARALRSTNVVRISGTPSKNLPTTKRPRILNSPKKRKFLRLLFEATEIRTALAAPRLHYRARRRQTQYSGEFANRQKNNFAKAQRNSDEYNARHLQTTGYTSASREINPRRRQLVCDGNQNDCAQRRPPAGVLTCGVVPLWHRQEEDYVVHLA